MELSIERIAKSTSSNRLSRNHEKTVLREVIGKQPAVDEIKDEQRDLVVLPPIAVEPRRSVEQRPEFSLLHYSPP